MKTTNPTSSEVIKSSLLLLLAPAVELVLLGWLRSPTGIDYDYLCPALCAAFILFFVLMKTAPTVLALQRKTFALNVGLLILALSTYSYPGAALALAIGAVASAFFLLVPPSFYFKHPERRVIVPAALLACSAPIAQTLFHFLAKPVTRLTSLIVYGALKLVSPVTYHMVPVTTGNAVEHLPRIDHANSVMVIIGSCGGLEGIFFFLFAITFLFILKPRLFKRREWGGFFLLGITFMYCLNVVRLALVFLAANYVFHGFDFAMAVFHNSIGWALYCGGLALYFRWMYGEYLRGGASEKVMTLTAPSSSEAR